MGKNRLRYGFIYKKIFLLRFFNLYLEFGIIKKEFYRVRDLLRAVKENLKKRG